MLLERKKSASQFIIFQGSLFLRLVKTQNGCIFHRRLDHNFQMAAVEKPPKGNLVLMPGRIEGHLVRFPIKMPVMNFLGARVSDSTLRRHGNPFIPVLGWSNDAPPDDGSTSCHSRHFSLLLWSPSLEPDWPTAPLWRGPPRPWSSPGCEDR